MLFRSPSAWLTRLARCQLAAPVPELLLARGLGPFGGLRPVAVHPQLRERLWLVLPGEWHEVPALRRSVAALQALANEAGALSAEGAGLVEPGVGQTSHRAVEVG